MSIFNLSIGTYTLPTVLLLAGLAAGCSGNAPATPTLPPVLTAVPGTTPYGGLVCPSDFCCPAQLDQQTAAACASTTSRKLDDFRRLTTEMSFGEVCAKVGKPDWETGSGLYILVYALDDSSRILIGFAGLDQIMYVNRLFPDGSSQRLLVR